MYVLSSTFLPYFNSMVSKYFSAWMDSRLAIIYSSSYTFTGLMDYSAVATFCAFCNQHLLVVCSVAIFSGSDTAKVIRLH